MTLLLFLAFLALDNPVPQEVLFEGTNLLDRIAPNDLVFSPKGDLFLLSYPESKVYHYGPDGQLKGSFGRKGDGPGEFGSPTALLIDEKYVYVQDNLRDALHLFDHNGKIIDMQSLPGRELALFKTKTGWAYANSRVGSPGEPVTVVLTDNSFKNPKQVLSLTRGEFPGVSVTFDGSTSKPEVKVNPAKEANLLAGSADGAYVYVRPMKDFKVHVIDVTTGKIVRVIERKEKALPFSEAFGEEQLQKVKDLTTSHGGMGMVSIVPDYPKMFPIVREMQGINASNLMVRRWTGKPDVDENYVLLDPMGKEQPLPCSQKSIARLLSFNATHGYIAAFSDEKNAYIVKVPLSKIDQAVADHPMDIERQPRVIARNN